VAQPRLGGIERVIVEHGNDAYYIASARKLVYAYDGKLFTVPFDPRTAKTSGATTEIADDVRTGPGQFAVAEDGTLAYVRGRLYRSEFSLISRDGTRTSLGVVSGTSPRLSPDGKRVAYFDGRDIWIAALGGLASPQRLTSGGVNHHPIWASNGERIAYGSRIAMADTLYWQRTDGGDTPSIAARYVDQPEFWSPATGRLWFLRTLGTSRSVWIHSPADRTSKLLAYTRTWASPSVSPDGRWLAVEANAGTSTNEIFVSPFPGHDTPIQVTHQGGRRPVWSSDGRELFFDNGDQVFVATVRSGMTPRSRVLEFDEPIALPIRGLNPIADRREYDVMPDGKSFLVPSTGRIEVEIITNRVY
jgi:hypothetical protein